MELDDVTYLTTPNYPSVYPKSTLCTWLVTSADNGYYVIIFEDLLNGDYMGFGITHNVSIENTIVTLGSLYAPTKIEIQHRLMWIEFESFSDSYVLYGFFLQISRVENSCKCRPILRFPTL